MPLRREGRASSVSTAGPRHHRRLPFRRDPVQPDVLGDWCDAICTASSSLPVIATAAHRLTTSWAFSSWTTSSGQGGLREARPSSYRVIFGENASGPHLTQGRARQEDCGRRASSRKELLPGRHWFSWRTATTRSSPSRFPLVCRVGPDLAATSWGRGQDSRLGR